MHRAVVFDFDGTLVDSYSRRDRAHEAATDVLVEFLERQGASVDRESLLERIGEIERTASETSRWDRDGWWVELLSEHGFDDPPEQVIRRATQAYWETTLAQTEVFPGVASMLERLSGNGVPIGVISDTDGLEGMKDRRLARCALSTHFDAVVVAGEDTPEAKPSTEPFTRVADELGVPPPECLYVGDNPHTDVAGAREVGMTTVLAAWDGSADGPVDPDHLVEDGPAELVDLVLSLVA